MDPELVHISKLLSLVLRHHPEKIGITLDSNGWVDVEMLMSALEKAGKPVDQPTLRAVVAQNNKQRFAFNADETRIRANQGHSVSIDLGLTPVDPPGVLYHGTATRFLDSITATGLDKRGRNHMQLSADRATAVTVGARHGKPIVLMVDAAGMRAQGYDFYLSENKVWLVDAVPVSFIKFEE